MNQYLEDILNLVVSFENLTNNDKKALTEAVHTAFGEASRLIKQRDAELAVVNSVQQALLDHMDMEGIYNMVGDRIRELFDAQVTGIYTFDHDTNLEHFQYLFEDGERLYPESRPLNQIRKWLIQNATMLLVNENADEVIFNITGEAHVPVPGTRLPKSMIFVPLIVGDVVQGCVSLQNLDRENAFTDSDIRLINTLTNSMSFALENARLFNETARLLKTTESRAAELETVNQISKALVSQLKFDSLVQLVGEKMRETFNADIVFLALHDRESNMIHFPYYYGDSSGSRPFGNGITENIILSKEPLLVNHDLEDIYEKMKADKSGKWVQSFLGVPITVGDQAIGVISVQSTELENRFDENDQRLLSTIASNVGVAMQNAEAYQKLQQALSELRSTQSQLIHWVNLQQELRTRYKIR
jgi:GAF domain-containing protein